MSEENSGKLHQSVLAVCDSVRKIAEIKKARFIHNLWIGNFSMDADCFGFLVRGISLALSEIMSKSEMLFFKMEADSMKIELGIKFSKDKLNIDLKPAQHFFEKINSFSIKDEDINLGEIYWSCEFRGKPNVHQIEIQTENQIIPPVLEIENFNSDFFNFEPLMASINNNLDSLLQIITLFLDKYPKDIELIHNSITLRDTRMVNLLATRLKASCEYMGLRQMAATAERIQKASKNSRGFDELDQLAEQLKQNYHATAVKMNEFLKSQGY
jgi:HPt (histidine-containing phosphotransfer) domain-containing protein